VHEKVDKKGRLTDEKSRQKIKDLLEALIAWTAQLKIQKPVEATI
jgi:chromate reductase